MYLIVHVVCMLTVPTPTGWWTSHHHQLTSDSPFSSDCIISQRPYTHTGLVHVCGCMWYVHVHVGRIHWHCTSSPFWPHSKWHRYCREPPETSSRSWATGEERNAHVSLYATVLARLLCIPLHALTVFFSVLKASFFWLTVDVHL